MSRQFTGLENLDIWLPDSDESLVNRWQQGHYQYHRPIDDLAVGAKLIADKSAGPLIQTLERKHNESFAFLAVMALVSQRKCKRTWGGGDPVLRDQRGLRRDA